VNRVFFGCFLVLLRKASSEILLEGDGYEALLSLSLIAHPVLTQAEVRSSGVPVSRKRWRAGSTFAARHCPCNQPHTGTIARNCACPYLRLSNAPAHKSEFNMADVKSIAVLYSCKLPLLSGSL
jgi:hypothetical protein